MFFLTKKQNTSLKYNDSASFSALYFSQMNQERSMLQKKHTVGHLKINISRKYVPILFFSEECKKSQCYEHELKSDYYISLINQM